MSSLKGLVCVVLIIYLVTHGTWKSFILGEGNSIFCSVLLIIGELLYKAIIFQHSISHDLHQLAMKLRYLRKHRIKMNIIDNPLNYLVNDNSAASNNSHACIVLCRIKISREDK